MSQSNQAKSSNQEGRILLAIQAIKQGQIQSIRVAAATYDVSRLTLYHRIYGMALRRDSTSNSCKFSSYEKRLLSNISLI